MVPAMMKAVGYRRFGPAGEVLESVELPRPEPGPGEVLVRLRYSGVNPSDVKARAGARPGVTRPAHPLIVPHSDGAGEIAALGEGVNLARLGQRVWVWNGQWQRALGTAAQYIALPQEQAVPLPDGITLETGATLGIPACTAAQAVFSGGAVAGETVLVSGGGGTVGLLAVQLARWGGARVIATASPRDFDRVRAAGAETVLDYRAQTLAEAIRDAAGDAPVTHAVEPEFGLNIAMLAEVLAPRATIAAYGSAGEMAPRLPFGPLLFKAVRIDIILVYLLNAIERAEVIARIHPALAGGALVPPVQEVFALDQCAAAHAAVEGGGRSGAVLLRID